MRLLPAILFVTGGAFSPENLKAIDIFEGLQVRGAIACQIREVSDGTKVWMRTTD